LYWAKFSICSEINTKHINIVCGQNVKLLNVKTLGASGMVPAYTNCDIQLQNVVSDDGLKSLKHVEHLMINKDTL
jgi:hypothetical protein